MKACACVVAVVLALVLAGCGAARPGATPLPGPTQGQIVTAAADPTTAVDVQQGPGLIPATDADCAQLGAAVLAYLTTGDDGGDPRLDQALAGQYATILAAAADARAQLARQGADAQITWCEAQHASAAAAAADAAQRSSAAASRSAYWASADASASAWASSVMAGP